MIIFVLFVYWVTVSTPAYAYIDPGAGSIILQVLLGGVAGALVLGKLYLSQLKDLLGKLFRRSGGSKTDS